MGDTMHYLIYKITNIINGKIYIGSHKTKDIDDGYMRLRQVDKKIKKEDTIQEGWRKGRLIK